MPETRRIDWNTDDWARKLKQQAEDSKEYRHKLYNKVDLKNKKQILDVGCGTGAITVDIAESTSGEVIGIDIDPEKLKQAEKLLADIPNIKLMEGDVLALPFEDDMFDLVVFNIVLIYVKDQPRALSEMVRVTKPGGHVLASLEPDYAGTINYPESPLTPIMLEAMTELGADLKTGRKLKYLFNKAGLTTDWGMDTESDFIFVKDNNMLFKHFQDQFWVREKLFKKAGWDEKSIEQFNTEESDRIKNGLQFHFTPCFYAVGLKKV